MQAWKQIDAVRRGRKTAQRRDGDGDHFQPPGMGRLQTERGPVPPQPSTLCPGAKKPQRRKDGGSYKGGSEDRSPGTRIGEDEATELTLDGQLSSKIIDAKQNKKK